MSDAPSPSRDRRYLALAVVGPVALTVLYLVVMEMRGEERFAPGEGAGAARRAMQAFWLYGAALLALIIGGTISSPRPTKASFAALSTCVSLVLMVIAFFVQMAR